jgi:hypothetical protein
VRTSRLTLATSHLLLTDSRTVSKKSLSAHHDVYRILCERMNLNGVAHDVTRNLFKSPLDECSLQVGTDHIKLVNSDWDLGVRLDWELTMKDQVQKVSCGCFFFFICGAYDRSVRQQATSQMLSALILSCVDCYNSILAGIPRSTLVALKWVRKAAALQILKFRSKVPRYDCSQRTSVTACEVQTLVQTQLDHALRSHEPGPVQSVRFGRVRKIIICSAWCTEAPLTARSTSRRGPEQTWANAPFLTLILQLGTYSLRTFVLMLILRVSIVLKRFYLMEQTKTFLISACAIFNLGQGLLCEFIFRSWLDLS